MCEWCHDPACDDTYNCAEIHDAREDRIERAAAALRELHTASAVMVGRWFAHLPQCTKEIPQGTICNEETCVCDDDVKRVRAALRRAGAFL